MQAVENPYIAVVARKQRNLKKKVDRILTIEERIAAGKPLDEEQLILVSSKQAIEKQLADLQAIKTQLEEVAKQQSAEEEEKKAEKSAVVEEAPIQLIAETTQTEVSEVVEQVSSSTQCDEVSAVNEATQCSDLPAIEESPKDAPAVQEVVTDEAETSAAPVFDPVVYRELLDTQMKKLLKALHVYLRYGDTTQSTLPVNVDFFGKTLLGQTSISGFDHTLKGSLRSAGYYVNEELSTQFEAIRGVKYSQISDTIDGMAAEMESFRISTPSTSLPIFNIRPAAVVTPAPPAPVVAVAAPVAPVKATSGSGSRIVQQPPPSVDDGAEEEKEEEESTALHPCLPVADDVPCMAEPMATEQGPKRSGPSLEAKAAGVERADAPERAKRTRQRKTRERKPKEGSAGEVGPPPPTTAVAPSLTPPVGVPVTPSPWTALAPSPAPAMVPATAPPPLLSPSSSSSAATSSAGENNGTLSSSTEPRVVRRERGRRDRPREKREQGVATATVAPGGDNRSALPVFSYKESASGANVGSVGVDNEKTKRPSSSRVQGRSGGEGLRGDGDRPPAPLVKTAEGASRPAPSSSGGSSASNRSNRPPQQQRPPVSQGQGSSAMAGSSRPKPSPSFNSNTASSQLSAVLKPKVSVPVGTAPPSTQSSAATSKKVGAPAQKV